MKGVSRREFFKVGSAVSLVACCQVEAAQILHPSIANHTWVHPGVFQRHGDLQFMKEQIIAARDPWKTAWDHLLNEPTSSLNFIPRPMTHIVRGSYGAGQRGDRELNESIVAAESHVLQWVVTHDEAHAHKVASILDAWSGMLGDFSGNDAMLLAGWTGGKWANIAEILRATWKLWPSASQKQFEKMLRTIYVPLLSPFFPEANGNWDAAMMHSLLGIAVYCEDQRLFNHVLAHYRTGSGSSGITRYIYPNGQCEESTRDQAHTQLGLGYFALTSLIAWNQKVDLFAEADNRLALGFEYTSKYMLGEEVFAFGAISEQVRGRFDDWYEVPLQHFCFERGIAMPYTEHAALKARPRSRSVLTMCRSVSGPTSLQPAPSPSDIAFQAGAKSTIAPADAVVLQPGESIQVVLDHAAEGSTVWIAEGLHQLQDPLLVPSGITLSGVGPKSILFLDPHQSGPALINRTDNLRNVTIRNLAIEAGTLAQPTRDPNQDRRPLALQLASPRGGIAFVSESDNAMRGLRFERVTIRNATLNGIEIFAAEDVKIMACNISFCGGAVAPGVGKLHSVKMTHVSNASVTASRIGDSFHGSGLALAFARDVEVRNCELARNALDGVELRECANVTLNGCLFEGNGREAVGDSRWMEPNRNIQVSQSVIRNNGNEQSL